MKSLKRLICSHGDDRQKASINRKKRRSFETSDRQQERRKTMHVCIDAEPENVQPDGSISVERRSFSSSTKTTYLKSNTNFSSGNSRSNSVSNNPSIVKSGRKKCPKKRWIYSGVRSSSVSSSAPSEENNDERNSMAIFLIRILRTFKRNKTVVLKTQRNGSMQPSFETHITAASATSNACDVISEHEQEQHELKSFADELHSERAEQAEPYESLL